MRHKSSYELKLYLIFILIFQLILEVNTEKGITITTDSTMSVVYVSVLFRHGMRTPHPKYLMVQYRNESYWPEGWWQLTNSGKASLYELGKWLRIRYSDLISDRYSAQDIYVVSSDRDRSIMSAQCCLAGLYPPVGVELWNRRLPWQPIPVHVLPKSQDNMLDGGAECPKFKQYRNENMLELTEVQKYLSEYLSANMGFPITDISMITDVYENFEKMVAFDVDRNITLHAWMKAIYPEPMKQLMEASYNNFRPSTVYKRLSVGGPLLKDMLTKMQSKREMSLVPNLKMKIYSGHDTSLTDLLGVLGVWDQVASRIPHAATILLELKATEQQYYVNVIYKNTTSDVYQLKIPSCQDNCPLDEFNSLMWPYLPQDWRVECF